MENNLKRNKKGSSPNLGLNGSRKAPKKIENLLNIFPNIRKKVFFKGGAQRLIDKGPKYGGKQNNGSKLKLHSTS